MTFAEGFYQYFRACPLIDEKKLNFNFHNTRLGEYFLETNAPEDIVKRYQHGNAVWQKPVYFCMMASFGEDARIQIDNSIHFEGFREWVELKNARKEFPQLPENCYPISLECTTDGYVLDVTSPSTAQYQIQMSLTYQRNTRR